MKETEMQRGFENEDEHRLLRALDAPGPSADSVGRVKRAIRAELTRERGRGWGRAYGIFASAASILLAIGTGWWSAGLSMGPGDMSIDPGSVAIAGQDEGDREILAGLDAQLDSLESWSDTDAWDYGGSALYDVLSELNDEAMELPPAASPS